MTFRIARRHSQSFDTAPVVPAGHSVRFAWDDEKNPGWFFGDHDGVEGYFPAAWFQIDREAGRATALRDYDARELTVDAGVFVDVLDHVGGWSRVLVPDGRAGWVPDECVEEVLRENMP